MKGEDGSAILPPLRRVSTRRSHYAISERSQGCGDDRERAGTDRVGLGDRDRRQSVEGRHAVGARGLVYCIDERGQWSDVVFVDEGILGDRQHDANVSNQKRVMLQLLHRVHSKLVASCHRTTGAISTGHTQRGLSAKEPAPEASMQYGIVCNLRRSGAARRISSVAHRPFIERSPW